MQVGAAFLEAKQEAQQEHLQRGWSLQLLAEPTQATPGPTTPPGTPPSSPPSSPGLPGPSQGASLAPLSPAPTFDQPEEVLVPDSEEEEVDQAFLACLSSCVCVQP